MDSVLIYDLFDLPSVMAPPQVRTSGPVSICLGSALWYGPPDLQRPRCGRGHRERFMRWRRYDAKCYACGYTEPLEVTANNSTNSARWNAWALRAELEWLDEFGEVREFDRRPCGD